MVRDTTSAKRNVPTFWWQRKLKHNMTFATMQTRPETAIPQLGQLTVEPVLPGAGTNAIEAATGLTLFFLVIYHAF